MVFYNLDTKKKKSNSNACSRSFASVMLRHLCLPPPQSSVILIPVLSLNLQLVSSLFIISHS